MVIRTEGSQSPYLAGFVTSPLGAHPALSGAATVEPVCAGRSPSHGTASLKRISGRRSTQDSGAFARGSLEPIRAPRMNGNRVL
jgi:hypothetical protein